jgi:benzoyl-CoA reductase subunit C
MFNDEIDNKELTSQASSKHRLEGEEMRTPASTFRGLYENRSDFIADWKSQGKKVFGYFCTYTPEEIIYAADILPIRASVDLASTTRADAHLPNFICSFSRECLDAALSDQYKDLDGYVSAYTCDTIRNLLWVWKRLVPTRYIDFISFPSKTTDKALDFLLQELTRSKTKLERFCGKQISDQSLIRAIKLYNENRTLLGKAYDLRKSDPPLISGTEALDMVRSATVTPKEEHNKSLRKFLSEVKERDALPKGRARLLISGPVVQDIKLIETIEDLGGTVVADDLCVGSRYFWDSVDVNGSPLKAIAGRYLGRARCPCRHPPEERLKYMMEMVKDFKVDGVVFMLQKFCDTHFFEYPFLEEKLKENGIPSSLVEIEQSTPIGALKTRVEAFMEMLEGTKT